MCNVCVAGAALATTSCGKKDCAALQQGHRIVWRHGPDVQRPDRRISKATTCPAGHRRQAPLARPTVYVRARARGQERAHPDPEGPADFQLRRDGEDWPVAWQLTSNLASAMALYGLDVKWGRLVPASVQKWTTYKSPRMPEIHELLQERDGVPRGARCAAVRVAQNDAQRGEPRAKVRGKRG
jgi:hypothetical protein